MEFLYQSTVQEVIRDFFSRSWVSYHSVPETIQITYLENNAPIEIPKQLPRKMAGLVFLFGD